MKSSWLWQTPDARCSTSTAHGPGSAMSHRFDPELLLPRWEHSYVRLD